MKNIIKKIKEKINTTSHPLTLYCFIIMAIILFFPYILGIFIICSPFIILQILDAIFFKNKNINNLPNNTTINSQNNVNINTTLYPKNCNTNNSIYYHDNIISNSQKNNIQNKQSDYDLNSNPMTKTELYFHKKLKLITDKYNLVIIPQLQLQRIFKVIDKNNITAFNKIKAKSIDFAVVDENYNYKLFIELDDYTHKYQNRIERDEFIDSLFKNKGCTLLRIKANNYYNLNDLELKIKETL